MPLMTQRRSAVRDTAGEYIDDGLEPGVIGVRTFEETPVEDRASQHREGHACVDVLAPLATRDGSLDHRGHRTGFLEREAPARHIDELGRPGGSHCRDRECAARLRRQQACDGSRTRQQIAAERAGICELDVDIIEDTLERSGDQRLTRRPPAIDTGLVDVRCARDSLDAQVLVSTRSELGEGRRKHRVANGLAAGTTGVAPTCRTPRRRASVAGSITLA